MSIDKKSVGSQSIVGMVVGYQIFSGFYIEGEINIPVAGGKFGTSNKPGSNGELKIYTIITYSAYRYVINKSFYFKAKFGLAYELIEKVQQVEVTGNIAEDTNTSSSFGAAAGAGFGFVFYIGEFHKPVMLEIEVSSFDSEVNIYTIGVTYPF